MVGSHFHLSKPYLSFMAVRNIGSSWLSREIVFTILVFICTGSLLYMLVYGKGSHRLKFGMGWGAILAGFAAVYCMASIYLLPTQITWNLSTTIISYYADMLLLGTTSLIVIMLMDLRFSASESPDDVDIRVQIIKKSIPWLTAAASLAAFLVISLGIYQIEFLRNLDRASAKVSLQLTLDLYQPLLLVRVGLTVFGVVWLVAFVDHFFKTKKSFILLLGPAYIACILVLIGEILERFLFYATHVRIGI
jgi:anaerobic dimethyl sulfoxide reductase subunit C (anchor subunit)